jgi:WD40 repeat protein/tetratricopeptide (TPR) repeat protein
LALPAIRVGSRRGVESRLINAHTALAMSEETRDLGPSPKTLDDLLAECIASEESGRAVDVESLYQQHPEHAAELREFLANRDQMRRLAEPLQGAAAGAGRRNGHSLGKIRYFGDYELLEEIAAGGMGIVYKARQVSLNRVVAVKMILKGTLASDGDVKRFRAEAEAAANLQHPGIVAIHEVGLHEGQHYFSMDFVEGHSLAQLPREQPLSARQAAEYVRDAAEAVHYAHQQGTLHRDLKPSNILIDRQNRVRITDFGLAKRIEGNSDLTLTGQILGTPSYMPPEQALSKRSLIGTASDVYSLGAVLYELLTGRPPFRGESPGETLRQVETLDPISPRLLSPTTPRDLETICFKCLEKEPHKRYLTAQHLADDLGRYLRGDPILAKPVSRIARLARWCRKRPAVAGLATAVAFLVLVVIPGLLLLHAQRIDAELQRTQAAQRTTQERLADSYLHVARASRLSNSVGQRHASLQAVDDSLRILDQLDLPETERQQRVAELRTEAIAALALPDLRVIQGLEVRPRVKYCDADAKHEHSACIVYEETGSSATGGFLTIRRLSDDKEVARFPGVHWWGAAISPDGKTVASPDAKSGRLNVWQLGDTNPLLTVPWAESAFEFSPSGRWLAVGNPSGSVDLYDLPTGRLAQSIKTSAKPKRIAFHPSEQRLAATCGSQLVVLDLESGARVAGMPSIHSEYDVAWDYAGRRIAVQQQDGSIQIWDFEARRRLATMAGDDAGGVLLEFDPTGEILASVGWRNESRLWNASTGQLLLRTQNESVASHFHARRPWIGPIRQGLQVGLWELEVPAAFRSLVHFPVEEFIKYPRLAVSPDSRLLAVQYASGVSIWELASGRELGYLPIGSAAPLFEPTGALLTMTSQALLRWPIAEDSGSPGTLRVGPPEKLLSLPSSKHKAAISRDGRVVVLCLIDEVLVWRTDAGGPPLRLPHADVRYLDVSHQGDRVATCSHSAGTIRIWDAATAKLVHEFETPSTQNDVALSPDGRWLTTSGGGHRLWRIDTWQAGPIIGRGTNVKTAGAFVSFPGGVSLLAIDAGDGTIRLVDPESGDERACLSNPGRTQSGHLISTPDGRRLIMGSYDSRAVEVWDLASLRTALTLRGLDWDAPPFPPAVEKPPLRDLCIEGDVRFVDRTWAEAELPRAAARLAENASDAEARFRRGQAHLHLGQTELALQDLERAAELGWESSTVTPFEPWLHNHWRKPHQLLSKRQERLKQDPNRSEDRLWLPYDAACLQDYDQALASVNVALRADANNAIANNLLARILLFGPARLRNPEQGLWHAQRAHQLDPSTFLHATTLAAGLIRTGRGADARPLLSERARGTDQIYTRFLLALVDQQEGSTSQARDHFQRGCQTLQSYSTTPRLFELGETYRLRAEVEEALQSD